MLLIRLQLKTKKHSSFFSYHRTSQKYVPMTLPVIEPRMLRSRGKRITFRTSSVTVGLWICIPDEPHLNEKVLAMFPDFKLSSKISK